MLVSIITPSYNSSKFISATIESVLAQDYSNWEMIIVDDHSKDNSNEIIAAYCKKDSRIQLIKSNNNVGAAEARNIALRVAKGKFIAFLDSDDLWLPEKLSKQINFMLKNDIAFSFTAYQPFSDNPKNTYSTIYAPTLMRYNDLLKNTIIGCLTVMIDKDKTGYFELPNKKSSHDLALWLKILRQGSNAYGLNVVLANYRIVSTSNTANKWKAAKEVWRVYRNFEKINIIKSLYFFSFYVLNALKKRL